EDRPLVARQLGRPARSCRDRLAEERVGGDVEQSAALQPRLVQLLRPKPERDALPAGWGALAGRRHQLHDRAGGLVAQYRLDLDAARLDLGHQAAAVLVVADPGDQPRLLAPGGRPGAEVRRLAQ